MEEDPENRLPPIQNHINKGKSAKIKLGLFQVILIQVEVTHRALKDLLKVNLLRRQFWDIRGKSQ